jgi:hypothetical protein
MFGNALVKGGGGDIGKGSYERNRTRQTDAADLMILFIG